MSHVSDPLGELCERLGLSIDWPTGHEPAVVRRGDRRLFRGEAGSVAVFLLGMREGIDIASWSRDYLLVVLGLPPAAETAAFLDELARLQAVRLELCRGDADSLAALLTHPNRRMRELVLRAIGGW